MPACPCCPAPSPVFPLVPPCTLRPDLAPRVCLGLLQAAGRDGVVLGLHFLHNAAQVDVAAAVHADSHRQLLHLGCQVLQFLDRHRCGGLGPVGRAQGSSDRPQPPFPGVVERGRCSPPASLQSSLLGCQGAAHCPLLTQPFSISLIKARMVGRGSSRGPLHEPHPMLVPSLSFCCPLRGWAQGGRPPLPTGWELPEGLAEPCQCLGPTPGQVAPQFGIKAAMEEQGGA